MAPHQCQRESGVHHFIVNHAKESGIYLAQKINTPYLLGADAMDDIHFYNRFYSKFPKIMKKSKISYPKTRHLEISDESVQSSNLTPTQLTSYEQKKKTREKKKRTKSRSEKQSLAIPEASPSTTAEERALEAERRDARRNRPV